MKAATSAVVQIRSFMVLASFFGQHGDALDLGRGHAAPLVLPTCGKVQPRDAGLLAR
jgi:hypothetical protein